MSPDYSTPQALEHTCPSCHHVYADDCLSDVAEFHLVLAKSRVVTACGIGVVGLLSALVYVSYQGASRGFATGVDLGHITAGVIAAFVAILVWAFPKKNGK